MLIFKYELRRGLRDFVKGRVWLVLLGICLLRSNVNYFFLFLLGFTEISVIWRLFGSLGFFEVVFLRLV